MNIPSIVLMFILVLYPEFVKKYLPAYVHVMPMPQAGQEEVDYICCDPQLGSIKCSLMFITVNIFVHLPA